MPSTVPAYVYLRFSKMEQADGDSEARQLRDVLAWCAHRGFETHPSRILTDRGRSGYAGAHLARGALGKFIREVESGAVPTGSVLVVEDFDRISRLPISSAQRVIHLLTGAGIRLGVVTGDAVFDGASGDELTSAVAMLLRVHLAHDESAKKRTRSKSVWISKRQRAAEGFIVSGNGPRWLDHCNGEWRFNGQAEVVRRIYDLCLSGYGATAIAAMFNRETVPVLSRPGTKTGPGGVGKRWTNAGVLHVLRSPSAAGTWQPRSATRILTDIKLDTANGIVTKYVARTTKDIAARELPNYYPAVVSKEVWTRAQNIISARRGGGGNKGRIANVLQGLVYCYECGGRLQLSRQRAGQHNALFCQSASVGACTVKGTVNFGSIVLPILTRAGDAFASNLSASTPVQDRIRAVIHDLNTKRSTQQQKIDGLIAALGDTVSPAVASQFSVMAQSVAFYDQKIAEEKQKLSLLVVSQTEKPREYDDWLADYVGSSPDKRQRAIRLLNTYLRQVIDRIDVWLSNSNPETTNSHEKGYWEIVTIGGWASASSEMSGWQNFHPTKEALERGIIPPISQFEVIEGIKHESLLSSDDAKSIYETLLSGLTESGRDIAERIAGRRIRKEAG